MVPGCAGALCPRSRDEGLAAFRARVEPLWQALPQRAPSRDRVRWDSSRFKVTHLREGLAEAGGSGDAVDIAARAHESAASVHTYEELRGAAEVFGDWPARRPAALERLRRGDRFGSRAAAVKAQVGDGDLGGAWADANDGGCDDGTWLELADASREARPDDAIRVYGRLVNQELEIANDSHYDRVVDLLGRWRTTLGLHGRSKELEIQVAAIRDLYARRTRLLSRMDKAGLT